MADAINPPGPPPEDRVAAGVENAPDAHVLVDELARVFCDAEEARHLASTSGFPREDMPNFKTPRAFWSFIIQAVYDGKTKGGLSVIARAAASMYPSNRVFCNWDATRRPGLICGPVDRLLPTDFPVNEERSSCSDRLRDSDAHVVWRLEIEGELEDFSDEDRRETMLLLARFTGNLNFRLIKMTRGSIVLHIVMSQKDADALSENVRVGRLVNVAGRPIVSCDIIDIESVVDGDRVTSDAILRQVAISASRAAEGGDSHISQVENIDRELLLKVGSLAINEFDHSPIRRGPSVFSYSRRSPSSDREAFVSAFDALSHRALGHIARYAAMKAAFLECDSHDLINDAVLCFVRGYRKWSPETLEKDFISAIRSISGNLYLSQHSRKAREARYFEPTPSSPSLDERIDHTQHVRCMLKYFEGRHDEDAALLIRAMLKHSSAKSAADSLGFTSERAQAALRRIRRYMAPMVDEEE